VSVKNKETERDRTMIVHLLYSSKLKYDMTLEESKNSKEQRCLPEMSLIQRDPDCLHESTRVYSLFFHFLPQSFVSTALHSSGGAFD